MTLLIIFLVITFIVGCIGGASAETNYFGEKERFGYFAVGCFIAGLPLGLIFMGIQIWGNHKYEVDENVTYTQKIVSLNDGTGIEGQMYGGLFVMRGYINDTQHFAYYREAAPSQYVLEKRDAGASTIHADATPETARLDVTDNVKRCAIENNWWFLCQYPDPIATFVHADFHVPANSIKNDFTLDAQ